MVLKRTVPLAKEPLRTHCISLRWLWDTFYSHCRPRACSPAGAGPSYTMFTLSSAKRRRYNQQRGLTQTLRSAVATAPLFHLIAQNKQNAE